MHKIAILPTLLTLGNAVCGFAAIAYASRIRFDGSVMDVDNNFSFMISAVLILGAMVFDAMDGYVARLLKSSSEFGGQLDSLCDAISFGVAPAFLLLLLAQEWQQIQVRQAIGVIAALYMACALLRLARFNLENSTDASSHKRFKGLPSPAAAGCLATVALMRGDLFHSWLGLNEAGIRLFVSIWAPMGGLIVALLMVSSFSYPHFTGRLLRRRSFSVIVQAVVLIGIIAMIRDLALFLMFWLYALQAPLNFLFHRGLRESHLPAHSPGLD